MKLLFPFLILLAACGRETISVGQFVELDAPVMTDLGGIWFADSLHGIACGGRAWESGFLLSSDDGGQSWRVDTVLNRRMEYVTTAPGGQAYACGQDMIFFRPEGSTQWQLLRQDFQWLRAMHFPSDHYGAVVSGEGYHDGRVHVFGPDVFWQTNAVQQTEGELQSVWYADSLVVVAVGAGWVIRSEDGGKTWERLHLTGDFFTAVQFADPQTGYICGNNGSLLQSTDGGRNWRYLRRGGASGKRHKGFRSLCFRDRDHGWLVGDGGIFWQTADGGAHWRQVADAPADADYTRVFVRGKQGWATAKNGRMFRFEE